MFRALAVLMLLAGDVDKPVRPPNISADQTPFTGGSSGINAAHLFLLTSTTTKNLTGISAASHDGWTISVCNVGAGTVVMKHGGNVHNATAADVTLTGGVFPTTAPPCWSGYWDAPRLRWFQIGGVGAGLPAGLFWNAITNSLGIGISPTEDFDLIKTKTGGTVYSETSNPGNGSTVVDVSAGSGGALVALAMEAFNENSPRGGPDIGVGAIPGQVTLRADGPAVTALKIQVAPDTADIIFERNGGTIATHQEYARLAGGVAGFVVNRDGLDRDFTVKATGSTAINVDASSGLVVVGGLVTSLPACNSGSLGSQVRYSKTGGATVSICICEISASAFLWSAATATGDCS